MLLFLSMSNGEAFGGQLPKLMQEWGNCAYYLIDASKSQYWRGSDAKTCCGRVHLELHEVINRAYVLGRGGGTQARRNER